MKNNKIYKFISLAATSLLSFSMLQAASGYSDSTEAEAIYAKEIREAQGANQKTKEHKTKKAPKQKYAGWYMRTKVSATAPDGRVYKHETAGVFGELKQSKWKKDKHDIPGYGAAVLQVVFPHYNWGDDSGDYFTDYRKWNKKRAGKRAVWTFLVRNQKGTDLSNAPIEIELDDAIKVNYAKENGSIRYIETGTDTTMKEKFTLVDVDNHKTYSVDELENANLTMDGKHTRTFRWVRGDVRKKDFRPVKFPQ